MARDEPDLVALACEPTLYELDRLDHERRGAGTFRLLDPGEDPRPHGRVDELLELAQGDGVREHDPPERLPVEGPVRSRSLGPPAQDEVMGRLPGRRHRARLVVRVDDV